MKKDKYKLGYYTHDTNGKLEKHARSFKDRQELEKFIRALKPGDSIETIQEQVWSALGFKEAARLLRRAGRRV